MIRRISGTVVEVADSSIIVDVHGLGYEVFVSTPHSFTLESDTTLHVYHALRDTASDLYGFRTRDERELFELLLTIPKVGPKSAAQIMAQADIGTLKNAVVMNDASELAKVSGIGKKTAEKIVLGLKDKAENLGWELAAPSDTSDTSTAAWQTDAIDALVALGYPQADARAAVQQLPRTVTSANEAVRAALQQLSQA